LKNKLFHTQSLKIYFLAIIDNPENMRYISIMKNNLTLAIVLVIFSIVLLVLSLVTKNTTTEKTTSLLLGLSIITMINGLKTIYRYFKPLNKAPNIYEK
jgi:hypothetical protein